MSGFVRGALVRIVYDYDEAIGGAKSQRYVGHVGTITDNHPRIPGVELECGEHVDCYHSELELVEEKPALRTWVVLGSEKVDVDRNVEFACVNDFSVVSGEEYGYLYTEEEAEARVQNLSKLNPHVDYRKVNSNNQP